MIDYLSYFIVVLYITTLVVLFFFSLFYFTLLLSYIRAKKSTKKRAEWKLDSLEQYPFVSIQLPVFNELYVIERLIHQIVKLDYPKDRFEIQVLDDSTDKACVELANKIIEKYQAEGFQIYSIYREDRSGFKAGALKYGLKSAKGEFVAIFDSDFLPKESWLKDTIPFFIDEKVGVVQTRWGHLNRDYSILTKVQAFALDIHFTLEQVGRSFQGVFLNFNGTAGIWRKQCIEDAGNWRGDTLTEDLDLSYRAQLKDWEIAYLENIETPAELPVVISAVRSQQYRWNKGGAENFRMLVRNVFSAKNISFSQRVHAFVHLIASSMFINLVLLCILSVPMLYLKNEYEFIETIFLVSNVFIISTIIFMSSYWVSYKNLHNVSIKEFPKFFGRFIIFLMFSFAFSIHNSIAVIEGLIGKKTAFIRTPKFNLDKIGSTLKTNKYINKKLAKNTYLEFFFLIYYSFAVAFAFILGDFSFLLMHLLIVGGLGYVLFLSFKNASD